jgi:hypothetical protein
VPQYTSQSKASSRISVVSIDFSGALRVPALAGNLGPCLDRFTMGAAILTILGRQTTATRVSTAVLVLIVHKQSFLPSLLSTVAPRFDSTLAVR